MGVELVKTKSKNTTLVRKNERVWKIMCEGGLKDFMEAYNGFDLSLSLEVVILWKNG